MTTISNVHHDQWGSGVSLLYIPPSFMMEHRPYPQSSSVSQLSDTGRKPRRCQSMFPLHNHSTIDVKARIRPPRSFSSFLPSPESSDCESPRLQTPRPSKQRVESTALPTPPSSDDESSRHLLPAKSSQLKESANLDGYSFPLHPFNLPHAHENTLLQTPPRNCLSASTCRKRKSLYPDRFISDRSTPTSPQSPAETYRISKHPEQLLPEEKFQRHGSATPDPFSPLKISRIRASRVDGVQRGRHTITMQLPRSRTIGLTTVDQFVPDVGDTPNRQVSSGNIWNMGGLAQTMLPAPVRGISNGRGGFLSSGTNAPMYESRLLDDLSTDQDVDQMERRLAAALDIDRTLRVFEISDKVRNNRILSTGGIGLKRKRMFLEQRTTWREGAWAQIGTGNGNSSSAL